MKRILVLCVMSLAVLLTSCKKRYVSPLETPSTTKAAEDAAYKIDFVQLHDDVLDYLEEKGIYSFVKDVDVSGDTDTKMVSLIVKIEENVSNEAIELLLTDSTKAIVDGLHTQDLRIDTFTENDFGNMMNVFTYSYKVYNDNEVIIDQTLNVGDSIPFDPKLSLETVMG